MAETLDNDLLNLWLRAGELTREEVRGLIDELQRTRDDAANATREWRYYEDELRAERSARGDAQ